MPAAAGSETLAGAEVRTLKQCPPFVDALSLGLLIPLACDLHVEGTEVRWDWPFPTLPETLMTRAPVGVHVPEQAAGSPFATTGDAVRLVLKFTNFWTLETPPGWSLLFMHPLNRPITPFHTLAGRVDCDRFGNGLVHFPALWTAADFHGTIPAGTPIAQAIAIPRSPQQVTCTTQSPAQVAATRDIQSALQDAPGVYRKQFRAR